MNTFFVLLFGFNTYTSCDVCGWRRRKVNLEGSFNHSLTSFLLPHSVPFYDVWEWQKWDERWRKKFSCAMTNKTRILSNVIVTSPFDWPRKCFFLPYFVLHSKEGSSCFTLGWRKRKKSRWKISHTTNKTSREAFM
jgi:hypothetical protein